MTRARSIITLTTDFGSDDSYVAEMKAVLLREAPGASLVDVTHGVRPQDILGGSVVLQRVLRAFSPGTVHLAVVDPGVGTGRRLLIVRILRQTVICPDNGLITWAWRNHAGAKAFDLLWRPERASNTFHGRDVMAPVAGRIAAGKDWKKLCNAIDGPILLDIAPAASPGAARIIHIDRFGNATTNVPAGLLEGRGGLTIRLGRNRIALRRTYGEVAVGTPVALVGSGEFLEIAVRNGSAARRFGLHVGDRIKFVTKSTSHR